MKKILMIILIIIIAGVLYLGYLGFIPVLASIFGTDKPRDLGVKYTQEDYKTADAKAMVKIETVETSLTAKEGLKCIGNKPVSNSFSGEELSAVANIHSGNWKYYPATDIQIKLNEDGSGALSALLHFERLPGYSQATGMNYGAIEKVLGMLHLKPKPMPIYLVGKATVSNGMVDLKVSKAEIGRFGIPSSFPEKYSKGVNSFFSQQVNAFPGFYVDSADFKGGKLNFKGTMPEKIITAKN
jgi:hypothetical protein